MAGLEVTPRDEQTVEILRCFPWGGADLTSNPTAIDPSKGTGASNVVPNRRFGMFAPMKGRQYFGVYPLAVTPQSLAIFPTAVQATQASTNILGSNAGVANILNFESAPANTGTFTTLSLPPYATYTGTTIPLGTGGGSWGLAGSYAYFCTGHDPSGFAYKIDVNNNVTYWQIAPPFLQTVIGGNNPNVRLNGAGAITATNVSYTFTYASATQESGAAFADVPYGPNAPVWGVLNPTNQQTAMDIEISPDPQVTLINIYRIDDALGQFLFVGSVPNTSGYGGAAAGFARFLDNTPSNQVTGQTLVERRDTPASFYDITYYEGRMWGFGHDAYVPYWALVEGGGLPITGNVAYQQAGPSDLWYSNYNEPWGWNSVTQVVQVNPNVYGDIGVAVRGVGGVIVALKTRSTWLVYGDSPDNLQTPVELGSQLGCMSKASVISALGVLRWVSNQGIMQFDGSNLANITSDIKAFFDTLVQADLQATCASFEDGVYILSFPTQFITWMYDTRTQQWFSSTLVATQYATQLEDPSLRVGVAGVTGTGIGALNPVYGVNQNLFIAGQPTISAYFASEGLDNPTSVGNQNAIVSTWTSRVWKPPMPSFWQFESVAIECATNLAPGTQITVNVITNPGSLGQATYPVTVQYGSLKNPNQVLELPFDAQGQTVQIKVIVTGTLGQFYAIEDVKLYGHMIRKMDQGDNR